MPLILVVDDSMDDLLFLEEFVVSLGHTCRLANSGEMALELLKIENFDLVISDYQMINGDGLWLLDQMKKLKIQTRFILVSSDIMLGGDYYLNQGADGFSPKPINLNHLRSLISSIAG